MPMISTYFFAAILLINVYCAPGPVQQPANAVTTGRLSGSLLAGSAVGVSVGSGVNVAAGVGDAADAVCVKGIKTF